MSTTYRITAVRTSRFASGGTFHDHIDRVRLNGSSGEGISRAIVIADLRNPFGDRYYTTGGGVIADVVVRACPHCGTSEYIATRPRPDDEKQPAEPPAILTGV